MSQTVNVTPDGGVKKTITKEGKGDYPKSGQEIHAHYVGTLQSDGTMFDSSRLRGRVFKFTLGQHQVIKGWDLGFASMRKGERATLTLTSDYAYGDEGIPGTIPPKATLVFDCELVDFAPSTSCVIA